MSISPEPSREFVQGLETHHPRMLRDALRMTRHPQEAQDLVQRAQLRALLFRDKYTPETDLEGWLLTIQARIFISDKRKNELRVVSIYDLPKGFQGSANDLTELEPAFEQPSAECEGYNHLQEEELTNKLRQELSTKYAQIIELIDLDGATYNDAGETLGIPAGSVASRLYRARRRAAIVLGYDPNKPLNEQRREQ